MSVNSDQLSCQTAAVPAVTTPPVSRFYLVVTDSAIPTPGRTEAKVDASVIPASSFGVVGHNFKTFLIQFIGLTYDYLKLVRVDRIRF